MARKKKKTTNIIDAINEVAETKYLEYDVVADALRFAANKAFIKFLNGGDDALTRIHLNEDSDEIEMYHQKQVVDQVEDDFLQIDVNDENVKKLELNVDDIYEVKYTMEDFSQVNFSSFASIFQQQIRELEKQALFEMYEEKMEEMITGVVESSDAHGTNIKVGSTNQTLFLPRRNHIGNETFETGDAINVYVVNVENRPRGAQINISRSHEGFLRRILEQEIVEIYDGTVIIANIAREAGSRSKVAVYSLNPDVDATGACIGPNGTRIQKVVSRLGNASPAEKIDVVTYYDNPALYIVEALRPAKVIGLNMNEQTKEVIAVVNNGDSSVAIGRRGVNVRLAAKLTGWHIDIKELDEAHESAISMQYVSDIIQAAEQEEEQRQRQLALDAYIASIPKTEKDEIPADFVAPYEEDDFYEYDDHYEDDYVEDYEVDYEDEHVDDVEEEPVIREIKTIKTLEQLESELEKDKQKESGQPRKKQRREQKEDDVEEEIDTPTPAAPRMEIYTEEELAEIEAAESEYEEEYDEDEYEEYDHLYDEDPDDWF